METLESGCAPRLAVSVSRLVTEVELHLRALSLAVGGVLATAVPRTASLIPELEAKYTSVIRDLEVVSGCGFLAKPGLFADSQLHHSWWAGGADATTVAEVNLDVYSESYYDYPDKDFFRLPAATGQLAVAGPYVDYLGTGQYILTWGCPVFISGAFLGVVGADVTLQDLQRYLLADQPGTSTLEEALVNGKGRIIHSTGLTLEPGAMYRSPDLTAWMSAGNRMPSRNDSFEVWPCPGTSWAVLRLSRQSVTGNQGGPSHKGVR